MNILPLKIHRWSGLSPEERQALLTRPVLDDSDKESAVQAIIDRVRKEGDTAVRELTAKFDGFEPELLKVPAEQLESAKTTVEPEILEAIEYAGDRIHAFHSVDIPLNKTVETAAGLICSVRYQPLSPVGLYIPGGSAPLISTILMLAIPAKLAGCSKVVLCTPPGQDGNIPVEMLAAADRCGVKNIYSVGGAQAIAAMAYGTETIPRCSKFLGDHGQATRFAGSSRVCNRHARGPFRSTRYSRQSCKR
jgi:histidinol dehydrogenase